jgi:ribosomal protein L29
MSADMTIAKVRELSDEKLVHHELQLERDLIAANFRLGMRQLEDTSQMSKLRHGIARARTVQRERERANGLGANALRDAHRTSFKASAVASATAAAGGFLKGIAGKLGIGEGEEEAAET